MGLHPPPLPSHRLAAVAAGAEGVGDATVAVTVDVMAGLDSSPRRPQLHHRPLQLQPLAHRPLLTVDGT